MGDDMTASHSAHEVEFLILGAGWTSTFLIPMLESRKIRFAATTTTGRDKTIPFRFDPDSSDQSIYEELPSAKTILITFPLKGANQSKHLLLLYNTTHHDTKAHWIQLGSTGIYTEKHWNTNTSPYDKMNIRAIAEDELLSCGSATILNLAGLYDEVVRKPQNWVPRVAKSKEDVKLKLALHLIHGKDVSRAIIACHENFKRVEERRWIVTDMFVNDWWALLMNWGGELADGSDIRNLVFELMEESDVRALPREKETLGRILDSRDFWRAVGVTPEEGSIS